jgi:hypothetical protein
VESPRVSISEYITGKGAWLLCRDGKTLFAENVPLHLNLFEEVAS